MKISFIIGTRPELIKVAPVIHEAKKFNFIIDIVNTAQHKDLLDPYWSTFNISPTHILDVMQKNQTLASLTSRAIDQIEKYIDLEKIKPDLILAQGDTTTVMAASIVGFYNKIKFGHIEAGLRSDDLFNPFPEEFNRKVASITTDYHFCPTVLSKENLLKENICNDKIHVVGNTIIDSLNSISKSVEFENGEYSNTGLTIINKFDKVVLITCHRRENHGQNLIEIIESISILAKDNPSFIFVWPLHPNPNVKDKLLFSSSLKLNNVFLTTPLEYIDLLRILKKSFCVISDSGGIQEEAPSFKCPVLVLRETTERPEGVRQGLAFLVGSNKLKIIEKFYELKESSPIFGENPYGDGKASQRIIDIISCKLND